MKLDFANCFYILHILVLTLLKGIANKSQLQWLQILSKKYFKDKAKISANEDKRRILEAIQISSTIIALTSENLFCNDDLILSLKVENFSRKVPTGSLRPVCVVALIMFTATKLVGAKSNTFDFSNSEFLYENVFVRDWYNTLVKNEFCTLHCLLKIWRDQ